MQIDNDFTVKGGAIVWDSIGNKYMISINTKKRYVLTNYRTGVMESKTYTKEGLLDFLQLLKFNIF